MYEENEKQDRARNWEDLLFAGNNDEEVLTLDELQESGFIEVVQEPEYSRAKLVALQHKYGLHSETVQRGMNEGTVDLSGIDENDLEEWLWAIKMFTAAGGDLFTLPNDGQDEGFVESSSDEPWRREGATPPFVRPSSLSPPCRWSPPLSLPGLNLKESAPFVQPLRLLLLDHCWQTESAACK